jgi:tetratricopeptide (TPR) repeat protein
MKPLKIHVLFLITVLLSFTLGCLAWEPGWKMAQAPAVKGDVNALNDKAKNIESVADTKEKVQQMIAAYEDALKIDPQNFTALQQLGIYYFYMGFANGEDKADKKSNYIKALQYCERAMYTNAEFKALVDKGENVWKACRVLKNREMMPMFFWYLSLGNCNMECYSPLGRLLNFYWTGRNKKVLERMTEIDPSWKSGRVYLSWAAYYTVAPGWMGGDMKKAEEYFNKALALGPHMSNFYYTRAAYYQTKLKNRKGFVEDLHHIMAIDPRHADTLPYPWAIWYHVKAIQLLKDTDKYFK